MNNQIYSIVNNTDNVIDPNFREKCKQRVHHLMNIKKTDDLNKHLCAASGLLKLTGQKSTTNTSITVYMKVLTMIIKWKKYEVLKEDHRHVMIAVYYFGDIKIIRFKKSPVIDLTV